MEYLRRIDEELERCNEQLAVQSLHFPMLLPTNELDTLLNDFIDAHGRHFVYDIKRKNNQFQASISDHKQRQQLSSYQLTIE